MIARKSDNGLFDVIGHDCILLILSYLKPEDLFKVAMVSTFFQSIANHDYLWRSFSEDKHTLKNAYIERRLQVKEMEKVQGIKNIKEFKKYIYQDKQYSISFSLDEILQRSANKKFFGLFYRKKYCEVDLDFLKLLALLHNVIDDKLKDMDHEERTRSSYKFLYDTIINILHEDKGKKSALMKHPVIIEKLLSFIKNASAASMELKLLTLKDILSKKEYQCNDKLVDIIMFATDVLSDHQYKDLQSMIGNESLSDLLIRLTWKSLDAKNSQINY